MSRLELRTDLRIIENNARVIRERIKNGVKMLAVVKADAYGHGSVQVAKRLEESLLCDYFAVATAEEGARLRDAGIRSDILILGYSDREEMAMAVQNRIHVTVYSKQSLLLLNSISEELGIKAQAHLKIETGMHRIGIANGEDLWALLKVWKEIPSVEMTGVFSHFSSADSDRDYTNAQFESFKCAVNTISDFGFSPIRHIAASSAMLNEKYQLDMVRAGIALYGVGDGEIKPLVHPAQTLMTHPVRLFKIEKGDKVGYSMKFVAQRDTIVMTVPCGYGDGYPRILSGRAEALVNGKRVKLIGNICMDMLMADVTDAGQIDERTEVVLMGVQGDERITPDELSYLSQTIPYEIMLGFSNRVEKTWVY